MIRRLLLLACVAHLTFGGHAAEAEPSAVIPSGPEVFPDVYLAPENQVFWRLRYGNGSYREFERDLGNPEVMRGSDDWKARFKGSKIFVRSPGKGDQAETMVFDRGRLVHYEGNGQTNDLPYAVTRAPMPGVKPPFFFGTIGEHFYGSKTAAKKQHHEAVDNLFLGKWSDSGRLCWPFMNPNENGLFYAGFAMLFLSLLVLSGRRSHKVAFGILFALAFTLMLATVSRGAWMAFTVGVALAALLGRRRFFTRANWKAFGILAAAFLVLGTGAFLVIGPKRVTKQVSRLVTRGFHGKSAWSNEVRYKMWKTAPQMMRDAPDGWGSGYNVGKAFVDWYEDLDVLTVPGSLMNDHLSRLVRFGSCSRLFYVFGWFFLLVSLGVWGWFRRNGFPLAVWAMFAFAAWFNPLMGNLAQWGIPVLMLAPVLWDARKLTADAKSLVKPAFAAVGAALLLTGAAMWLLRPRGTVCEQAVPIHVTPEHGVEVSGRHPQIWVVDDGATLGGVFTCKEIRSIYLRFSEAPSIGYAPTLKNLPSGRIRRLVLGGLAGDAWLRQISSSEEARRNLPGEVVFLSPPFPPSAIPPQLLASAKVWYVTGEFNARHMKDEFASAPSWVEIVPAMELYLANWMRYAVRPLE